MRELFGSFSRCALLKFRFRQTTSLLSGLLLFFAEVTQGRAEGRVETALRCSERHVTALGQVACELARSVPDGATPVLVPVARLTSLLPIERPDRISEKLSALLAAELGPRARSIHLGDPAKDKPSPTAEGAEIVELRAVLGPSHLSASAELVDRPRRFWERFRAGRSRAPRVTARRPIDAELRSFLPAIPLVLTRVERASPPDESILALACGDADPSGDFEIISVGRRRIQLGRIVDGRFRTVASVEWNELSEVAPHPVREPIASAWTSAPGIFDVGLTDRAEALRLDRTLSVVARFPSQLPWPGGGCAQVKKGRLEASRAACSLDFPKAADGIEPIDTVAGARLTRKNGSSFEVFVRRRSDARMVLALARRSYELETVGAQIAVADLNADGRAELLTTANTLDPSADVLRVQTLSEDGTLQDSFRVPIPGGARAVCVCPSQGAGLSPILAASAEALWILR